MYQIDWDNMSSSDWEDVHERGERLKWLNEAYGFPFPSPVDLDHGACKAVYLDICEHRNYWFEELFHPHEADDIPSNLERALVVLTSLADSYNRRDKNQKALDICNDLIKPAVECFRVQALKNTKFKFEHDHKDRFYFRQYAYYAAMYNAASVLADRTHTMEAYRKAVELEIQYPNAIKSNIMLSLVTQVGIVRKPVSLKKFRTKVSDESIWKVIQAAKAMRDSVWKTGDLSIMCPICATTKDLRLCSGCRQVSFCCREHQVEYWPRHKNDCRAAQARKKSAK